MENNPEGRQSVSAEDALAHLDALADSRSALANHVVTPPWYHPALAGLIFLFVAGTASERWSFVTFMLYCAGLVWLVTTYRRITGVWANGWNRTGGRAYAVALLVALLGAIAVAYAVRGGTLPWWWACVAAGVAAGFAAWVGPRFDASFRAAMRETR